VKQYFRLIAVGPRFVWILRRRIARLFVKSAKFCLFRRLSRTQDELTAVRIKSVSVRHTAYINGCVLELNDRKRSECVIHEDIIESICCVPL